MTPIPYSLEFSMNGSIGPGSLESQIESAVFSRKRSAKSKAPPVGTTGLRCRTPLSGPEPTSTNSCEENSLTMSSRLVYLSESPSIRAFPHTPESIRPRTNPAGTASSMPRGVGTAKSKSRLKLYFLRSARCICDFHPQYVLCAFSLSAHHSESPRMPLQTFPIRLF